ncbi:response regulator transcription factor [uncultured Sphingomonas sp.]|uniref:LuxR C-terminal-related transcriptional regulator n=1 Tax=uncultured Sphingomonas sp. TaxID=158754 RepID=UPI0025D2D2F4|nr:response regulator transcription factor [uncultured Sphingomonas sp.]
MRQTSIGIVCPTDLARESLRAVLEARSLSVDAAGASVSDLRGMDGVARSLDLIVVVGELDRASLDTAREAKASFPDARVALTLNPQALDLVAEALGDGVDGILLEDMSCDQLAISLRLIALGERVLPSRIFQHLLNTPNSRAAPPPTLDGVDADLSDREMAILKCLMAGEANKVISRRLGVTEATVKVHVKAILRKLNVANRTQAALWALAHGLNRAG